MGKSQRMPAIVAGGGEDVEPEAQPQPKKANLFVPEARSFDRRHEG